MNDLREDRFSNPELDALQENLKQQLDFSPKNSYVPKAGDRIYTIDVRYIDERHAQVGIDVVIYPDVVLPAEIVFVPATGIAYVPGYFSFYEGPVVLAALEKLSEQFPAPDLVIVDGHGLAHPRGFGLACYVGAKTGLPTLGIAKKNLLEFDRKVLSTEQYATHEFRINGETAGVAIRLQEGINPVFISAGNRISLETAIAVIHGFTQTYKLPENLRRADQASRKER
jgi:deoxyribonuclease V